MLVMLVLATCAGAAATTASQQQHHLACLDAALKVVWGNAEVLQAVQGSSR
jgi:hypothetical protein